MALTLIEQIKILRGVASPQEVSLSQLVEQSAVVKMLDFRENYVDPTGNALAESYVNKMLSLYNGVYNISTNLVSALSKIIIAIYAPTGDYVTVEAAPDNAWATFIDNNMIEALEQISGITREEVTAYNAL